MRRRVTVVGLSVCVLSHISPLERLFVLKFLSRTQQATKVKKFVGFSLKPLRCGDPALPPLKAIHTVGHFSADSAHAHAVAPRVLHFSAFINILMNVGKTAKFIVEYMQQDRA